MKTLYRATVACALIALAGCAAGTGGKAPRGRLMTANTQSLSVRPEITIPGRAKKEVTDALVAEVVARGFTVGTVTDYNIVFTKPVTTAAPAAKRGARTMASEQRLSFTIVEAGGGVRLVLTNQIVTNPGTPYEKIADAGAGPAGDDWQQFLKKIATLFKGRVGLSIDAYGTITYVTPGSPAMEAGIQTGDKIIRVDGAPYARTDQLIGDPDSKVIVVVLRQGQELPFILYRKVLK